MLLCTNDDGAPTVGGAGSDACGDGEPFVRWEWTGAGFVAENGPQGTTMVATEFKEPGEPVEAEWTSSIYNVSGAVVGAGGDTCTYPGDSGSLPHSGTVESCEGSAGGGGAASVAFSDTVASSLSDVLDGIVAIGPLGTGGSTVVPLALFALGAAVVHRRH